MSTIRGSISEARRLICLLHEDRDVIETIQNMVDVCVRALHSGNKIIFAGNGGSASDAQHFACELVGRFNLERKALPAMALSADSAILTSIGNDYGYERIFRRQLEANATKGDVFVAISTSGKSKNILQGLEYCNEVGITSLGLTGEGGGKMVDLCTLCITVPSSSTPRIQEMHTLIGHAMCAEIERKTFQPSQG